MSASRGPVAADLAPVFPGAPPLPGPKHNIPAGLTPGDDCWGCAPDRCPLPAAAATAAAAYAFAIKAETACWESEAGKEGRT